MEKQCSPQIWVCLGSYVISVSAGTGCYRHIQISRSATLHKKHKAIISAFDFGDEWRFQCKLLRELEETVDIPRMNRSVGESPEQYPDFDDWDEEFPEELTWEQIDALYDEIPLTRTQIRQIHRGYGRICRIVSAAE